jgi:hypothetical protein
MPMWSTCKFVCVKLVKHKHAIVLSTVSVVERGNCKIATVQNPSTWRGRGAHEWTREPSPPPRETSSWMVFVLVVLVLVLVWFCS